MVDMFNICFCYYGGQSTNLVCCPIQEIESSSVLVAVMALYQNQKYAIDWPHSLISFFVVKLIISLKATWSVTFDLLIFELMFLFVKNTVIKLKSRYTFYQFRKS